MKTIKTKQVSFFLLFGALVLVLVPPVFASLEEIETAIVQEDFEKAGRLAEDFLKGKPNKNDSKKALHYLGITQLWLNKTQDARETFRQLLKEAPEPTWRDRASIGIADSYYLEGHYDLALEEVERLFANSPRSEYLSLIYLKMARCHLKLARWQKAEEYLKRIANDFPGSLEAQSAKRLLEEKQYFAVQVGAFLERNRAEALTVELKEKGEYAYIIETLDKENRKFYRVRVGKFALLDEAQSLKTKLTNLGYPTRIYP